MTLSIPKFIKTAFAFSGQKNNIPETTNNVTGAAGYNQGFSEINMLPEGAGGIPPDGKDFNGIFYEITSALQYIQSGATFPYNQDFADAIGGYDVGALVLDSGIRYVSTISGNSLPPPSAGWQALTFSDPTETVRGLPFVATNAEVAAGTNANKMVTPAGLRSAYQLPLGQGQTWIDVTSSRAIGTTYTNTTGRAIAVSALVNCGNQNSRVRISCDGSAVNIQEVQGTGGGSDTTTKALGVFAIIPAGSTYSVTADIVASGGTGTFTVGLWKELRT